MVGDFDAACAYADIGLPNGNGRIAVDLGCGHGVHSIPLARREYRVLSIDTSAHLLNELKSVTGELRIQTCAADLTAFDVHLGSESAMLITCMGDTLTHLPSIDVVNALIHDCARKLMPDGLLTFSFRDYSTKELTGTDRFIPVRSDDHRIHTCFLEYRPTAVLVHDIIQSLVDSTWRTSISAYPKLRLCSDVFTAMVESYGLSLIHRTAERSMLYFAFKCSRVTAEVRQC